MVPTYGAGRDHRGTEFLSRFPDPGGIGCAFHPSTMVPTYGAGRAGKGNLLNLLSC